MCTASVAGSTTSAGGAAGGDGQRVGLFAQQLPRGGRRGAGGPPTNPMPWLRSTSMSVSALEAGASTTPAIRSAAATSG